MLLVISFTITILIKLPLCDEGTLSAVILPLAVAAAAPKMPGCMTAQREQMEIRTNTVTLITGFKRVLTTLLNQNGINI